MIDIPPEGLQLNLGCGRHTIDGWFCVDAVQHPKADRALDLVSDLRKIDLPDGCARRVLAIHVWEHFYPWECKDLIAEWSRLMRPRARLEMEMPDLMKFCRNILNGRTDGHHPDQFGLWGMYGDPTHKDELMMHHWGWTFKSLRKFLKEHGFTDVVERETEWHVLGRGVRDFRIEAVKA